MMATGQVRPGSLLSPQYVNGFYLPSGLLLLGVGITKMEWLPYAVVVVLLLGAWTYYSNGNCATGFYCGWLAAHYLG